MSTSRDVIDLSNDTPTFNEGKTRPRPAPVAAVSDDDDDVPLNQLPCYKKKEEKKQLGVYLHCTMPGPSCVGLDNGWNFSYNIGPADRVELFSQELQEKYGTRYKAIYIKGKRYRFSLGYWKSREDAGYDRVIFTETRAWSDTWKHKHWKLSDVAENFARRHVRTCFGQRWTENL